MQRYRRAEQGPMREAAYAENNAKFFNYDVEPIPQADKPISSARSVHAGAPSLVPPRDKRHVVQNSVRWIGI